MSKRSWKEHLLSSGLPLEYSVARVFEQLENWRPKEFSYERKNAEGVPTIFSVDLHATRIHRDRCWFETLVECKYRHDGTKWIFTPFVNEDPWINPDPAYVFVALDQCCDRTVDREKLAEVVKDYPCCEKGIEILPEDANPKTIEQALQQLRYGVAAKAVDSLQHQMYKLGRDPTPVFVIFPVIVTTAELWRLKVGATVEDVRNAEEISAVAETFDALIVSQTPNNLDAKHTHEMIHSELSRSQQITTLREMLQRTSGRELNDFLGYLANHVPSMFAVITYSSFYAVMKKLNDFFTEAELLKPREDKNKDQETQTPIQ